MAEETPDSDKEVFFGRTRTLKEEAASLQYGQNYLSPNQSTPRLNYLKINSNNGANLRKNVFQTPKDVSNVSNLDIDGGSDEEEPGLKEDTEIINLDASSDSVQLISDSESFISNETGISDKFSNDELKRNDQATCIQQLNETDKKDLSTFDLISGNVSFANKDDISEGTYSTCNSASNSMSIQALLAASSYLEGNSEAHTTNKEDTNQYSTESSSFIETQYSLNAISDSVLNISHGSSLASPCVEPCQNSTGLVANPIYEDISYDAEQILVTNNQSGINQTQEPDLHMSVDETDFQQFHETKNSVESSLFESCLNESNKTNFFSLCNSESQNPLSSKQTSLSFHSYRDNVEESILLEGVNQIDLDEHLDDEKETSFEIVVQNRQNSFAGTCKEPKAMNPSEKKKSQSKPESKLPVATNIPILKPSSLVVKSQLKKSNFIWSKNLPKSGKMYTPSTLPVPCKASVSSTSETKTNLRTPSKIPKINISGDKKTPSTSFLALARSGSKTPSTSSNKGLKTPTVNSARSNTTTPRSLKAQDKKNSNILSQEKERYKNVISPVRAYINCTPSTMLKNAQCIKKESTDLRIEKKSLYITTFAQTSKTKPHVSHKLAYGSGQENEDPNYSRDTLPPRVFEPADTIFVKETEQSKRHLPKLGENMMKLIDTPRPKIIRHEGQVAESPREKGCLVPNIMLTEPTPDSSSRISVRVVKTLELE